MKNVISNIGFWIAGISAAFVGVAIARLIAPSYSGTARIVMTMGGQLLALCGLFILCLGVRRRIKQTAGQ